MCRKNHRIIAFAATLCMVLMVLSGCQKDDPEPEPSQPEARSISITFDDPVTTTGGISLVPNQGDCETSADTVDGQGVISVSQYAYFDVTDEEICAASELTLSVTLLDQGSSSILFEYCSESDPYEDVYIQQNDTGEFVTLSFPLANANFDTDTPQNCNAEFRFGGGIIRSVTVTVGIIDDTETKAPDFAPQTDLNNMQGKGVAGYQAWFHATDIRTDTGWGHWSNSGNLPAADNVHTEMYPYTADYTDNGATLYQSGLGDLDNGDPALLFNSTDKEIIDTHFEWMKEYDIDGAAIQRFYSSTSPIRSTAENLLQTIQKSAEKHGRIFYVMYDFSGTADKDTDTFLRTVKLDFIYSAEMSGVVSSQNYAHADGKPVVCLWGISGDPESGYCYGDRAATLIEWFQSRGYYVIGGTPDNQYHTRSDEALTPFTKLDMISPWTVGRYDNHSYNSWLYSAVSNDMDFCEEYDIDYQPVIFSGFAWTNMGNNGTINDFPRDAGQFLWDQAYVLKNDFNINTVYFAMFDEYDEATAIMKAASDYFEIPTDQYFLTLSADGWWLSNDYYLRAAGAVIDMMQGKTELRDTIDIPHSTGPIYWRNSFESRENEYVMNDSTSTDVGRLDVCLNNPEWLTDSDSYATGTIDPSTAHSGQSSFRLQGTAPNGSEMVYKIADTVIDTDGALELTYSLYAANENGRRVYVDLLLEDGTRLSDQNANITKTRGKVGEWTEVTLSLGSSVKGQKILGVAVGYAGGNGAFDAYIDDIIIQNATE